MIAFVNAVSMPQNRVCRAAVLAAPVLVPASLAAVLRRLTRRLPLPTAYDVGLAVYRLGRCIALPLWVLGPFGPRSRRYASTGAGPDVTRWRCATLLHDYDLRAGRLWLFDVVGIALLPALARAWRLHRNG